MFSARWTKLSAVGSVLCVFSGKGREGITFPFCSKHDRKKPGLTEDEILHLVFDRDADCDDDGVLLEGGEKPNWG